MSDFVRKSDVLHLLYEIFNKYRMSTDKTNSICNSFGNEVFEEIKNMPIAYSVDKVIEELEKASWEETDISTVIYIDDATEIVKQSGKEILQ